MTRINTTQAQQQELLHETDRKSRLVSSATFSQKQQMQERMAAAQTAQTQRELQLRSQGQVRFVAQGVLVERSAADAQAKARATAAHAEAAKGDANPGSRFDSPESLMPGGFFSEFTDSGGGKGQGQGDGTLGFSESAAIHGADDTLEMSELAAMLPADGNSGVFELLMPDGENLGVVVSSQSNALSYLLSPSSEKLAGNLRQGRMELEDKLERLTHRNVNITVL